MYVPPFTLTPANSLYTTQKLLTHHPWLTGLWLLGIQLATSFHADHASGPEHDAAQCSQHSQMYHKLSLN